MIQNVNCPIILHLVCYLIKMGIPRYQQKILINIRNLNADFFFSLVKMLLRYYASTNIFNIYPAIIGTL